MAYREPPNICPGRIFVRKYFLMGAYAVALYTFIVSVNYVRCEPLHQSKHVHDQSSPVADMLQNI
jgi:hypothetical protein